MHVDLLDEVWAMLDRESLAQIAEQGPVPVFAVVSGAHLYGFASPDSDVDLRGAFMLPAEALLGLHPPAETITVAQKGALDLDWVAHDVRKFARLMTNHNGYVLEQLFSPLVVIATSAHEELRYLGRGCITRPTARHYQGFARGRRKRLREPDPTVKHVLYAYRVLMTGIHMMRTGEVVSNLAMLNAHFGLREVEELAERKRSGAEKMVLDEAERLVHDLLLDRLERTLQRAYDESSLPVEPTTVADLEDFVVRIRLEMSLGR